jgi:hypothetical protein
MKKTFSLRAPGKDDARVRDKIRQEINRYVRRERQKKLPEGYDHWEFACRVGASAAQTETRPFKELGGSVDAVAQAGATEVYIEIVATPAERKFSR